MVMVLVIGFMVSSLLHLFMRMLTNDSSPLLNFAFFSVAGFLKNSNFDPKGPFCSRILTCAWLLFTFLVTEHFGARLRSVLLLTHYRGAPFENLDEAMDAIEYQLGWKMFYNDTFYSPLSYCYVAQCTRLRKLYKRSLVLKYNVSLETVAENDHYFGFGSMLMVAAPHKWNVINDAKRILFIRDTVISPFHVSYAVSKDMSASLRQKLNMAIAKTIGGYSTLHSRYRRPYDKYVNKHFQQNANVLLLNQLVVLFRWTGKLLLFSLVCLLGEVAYFRYGQLLLRWFQKAQHRFGFRPAFEETRDNIELTHFSHLSA
ncbi:unnamed protein product [Cylicocyclus nassatus]|uniref:Uncharacterized protein n=1 Tax=Cylicocyclus nassatus TaxID=53992 RepID=A0AA36HC11_CYLNA|nr:unnamed protein product [Cylicocyclus nassatus]